MPQSVQRCWVSSKEKVDPWFVQFEEIMYLCTRWWVIKTAGDTSSGVHWVHFIAECGIEYGLQFVTQFFLNSPDCLYTKKSWEFFQSYEKKVRNTKRIHKFFVLWLRRKFSKSVASQSHVRKNSNLFGFSLTYSYLFALREGTLARKNKEKLVFLWFFARLFVPLHPN